MELALRLQMIKLRMEWLKEMQLQISEGGCDKAVQELEGEITDLNRKYWRLKNERDAVRG